MEQSALGLTRERRGSSRGRRLPASSIMHGVVGAEKLVGLFGCWPSFHDAQVISILLERSGEDGNCRPTLVATVRAFEISDEVAADGTLRLAHECIVVLKFQEVVELALSDFNRQNVLSGLHIVNIRERQLERQHFEVSFSGSWGVDAHFQSRAIDVVSVTLDRPAGHAEA
jgi:immunity protein 50 of polymorphic toxin system